MQKRRLDEILLETDMVLSKEEAFIVVTEGKIFVDGQKAISPGQPVNPDSKIELRRGREFVGRGALKLKGALEQFKIDVTGKVCVDIGASTGGFTQILLRAGAKKVYAIDTTRGKLDLKLRTDPRVVVMENTDVRDVQSLPDQVQCVTIDISLIPLENILSRIAGHFLQKGTEIIALFKPQYQTRDQADLKHGIIIDDTVRQRLLHDFLTWVEENGFEIIDQMKSPIQGSEGNIEYLLHLKYG